MTVSESFDVVTLGEAMVMLVAGQPGPLEQVDVFHKRTAGAETNVAIGLARLGLRVGWGSRLGQDSMGRYLLDSLRGEGVDCSQVILAPGERTGMLFKDRVMDGSDPAVEYHRAGSAASRMRPGDVDRDWLLSARHLHATGVFAAVSADSFDVMGQAMRLMREAGRSVSFDTNLRPSLWASTEAMRQGIHELAALADWVLPGIEEGRLLTGEHTPEAIARFYLDLGARLVIVKLGPDGAYYDDGARRGHVPACPVPRVVDTVGAGDGFAVGVISGLLEGLPLDRAVMRGAWIGARAVQVPGDTEGLPTRAVLQQAGL
ncbi:MAG: sugar kinase [Castellaniella sp.]|uniref:sugar kinase n=1 Tax=Castellaniella sp. TaxID=1955812 RepID=UPI003A8823AE